MLFLFLFSFEVFMKVLFVGMYGKEEAIRVAILRFFSNIFAQYRSASTP